MAKKLSSDGTRGRGEREFFGDLLNGEPLSEASARWFHTEPDTDPDPWRFDLPELPRAAQPPPAAPSVSGPDAAREARLRRGNKP